MTIRKQLAEKNVNSLSATLNTHPEIIQKVKDPNYVKDVIGSANQLLIHGVQMTIKNGGWEQLISGAETNADLQAILTNPSVILYSQVVMALVLADSLPDQPLPPTD